MSITIEKSHEYVFPLNHCCDGIFRRYVLKSTRCKMLNSQDILHRVPDLILNYTSVGQEGNPLFPHTASASLEFFRRLLGSVVRVQAAAGVWIKPRITPRVLGPSALLTNRTAPHLPAAPTSVNQSSSPPQFSFGILQDRF